ncbi:MAG: DUF58 domain-containing protein [Microbacteriaceae bacterium]|nr:DUF58 domain-containing protein [Microbacteriaceae bacterium]
MPRTVLLNRVKSKLFLHAHRRVANQLDGQYKAIFHGRSLDFDDLREYIAGDEVRDIDWKASARHGSPLVKRYTAERKHRVLFAVDNGRNLAAVGALGAPKRDTAVFAMGVLGYLAQRHGDQVSLIAANHERAQRSAWTGSESGLERLLHTVNDGATLTGAKSNVIKMLDYISKTVRGRHFLVIIADDLPWNEECESLVRRLSAQHEVVWLHLSDYNPTALGSDKKRSYDVDGSWEMPELFQTDKQLQAEFDAAQQQRMKDMQSAFNRCGASFAKFDGSQDELRVLLEMLKRRANAK